jgi:hypothetical protein
MQYLLENEENQKKKVIERSSFETSTNKSLCNTSEDENYSRKPSDSKFNLTKIKEFTNESKTLISQSKLSSSFFSLTSAFSVSTKSLKNIKSCYLCKQTVTIKKETSKKSSVWNLLNTKSEKENKQSKCANCDNYICSKCLAISDQDKDLTNYLEVNKV